MDATYFGWGAHTFGHKKKDHTAERDNHTMDVYLVSISDKHETFKT
jgi:hypothetical protein